MKTLNVHRVLEANKENRNFQQQRSRVQSTLNLKDDVQANQKPRIIRITKWNKSVNNRSKAIEEQRHISQENQKSSQENQKSNIYHHGRNLKNRSLTNIADPLLTQVGQPSYQQTCQAWRVKQVLNPQLVQPYHKEIFDQLLKTSKNQQSKLNYKGLILQTQITDKMHSILMNWLIEVHYKFKLKPETLFLAIHIIDRYLECTSISKQKFQLLGISSLYIASKYEEVYSVPKSRDLAQLCEGCYTKIDIQNMEGQILSQIGFELSITSPYRILEHIDQIDNLSSIIYGFAQGDSALIAAASLMIQNRINKTYTDFTIFNIDIVVIKSKSQELFDIWQNQDTYVTYPSLFKKYAQVKYGEVSKIKSDAQFC